LRVRPEAYLSGVTYGVKLLALLANVRSEKMRSFSGRNSIAYMSRDKEK
jgi:hypothetical protein